MTSREDQEARIREIREALRSSDDQRQRTALYSERVRIATVLLRFGKTIDDPNVMVDALLAAASQTIAEHKLDPVTVQNDFVVFLTAAQRDLADRHIAVPDGPPEPSGDADPTKKLN